MTLEEFIVESRLPRVEAQALASHALGISRLDLIMGAKRDLPAAERARIARLFTRRSEGEPLAYLVGAREFFSLEFHVTPAVLIPRPETELLVEFALERIEPGVASRVLDLSTGSGCVAVSIAKHRPLAAITAVDRSVAALAVGRVNARFHAVAGVEMMQSDWFGGLGGRRYDVIVANPPYIAAGDPHLARGDLRFEPKSALEAGADGLDCIRTIIAAAPQFLAAGGWLAVEHGYDQGETCRQLLNEAGCRAIFTRRDLAEIERVSGGQWTGQP